MARHLRAVTFSGQVVKPVYPDNLTRAKNTVMENVPGTPGSPAYRLLLARHRLRLLHQLEGWLEMPMAILAGIWLALMVADLGWGIGAFGQHAASFIWAIFVLDFLLRLAVAPHKFAYLRRNWLTALALLLPALRMFRFARALRALARLRGLQLVRILASLNRGMKALGKTMRRRGLGYVLALTVMVALAGAAGMMFFERNLQQGSSFNDFWTALWWTAMLLTTMGSEAWPHSPEGRALCLFLAIYAFTVFGYVTAAIATFFIGRDASDPESGVAVESGIEDLKREIAALREEIRNMNRG